MEEITMENFNPSDDFVQRTMSGVRAYEREMRNKRERLDSFLLSKHMRFALSAGAILLGILNLIRMASTLIFPALCL